MIRHFPFDSLNRLTLGQNGHSRPSSDSGYAIRIQGPISSSRLGRVSVYFHSCLCFADAPLPASSFSSPEFPSVTTVVPPDEAAPAVPPQPRSPRGFMLSFPAGRGLPAQAPGRDGSSGAKRRGTVPRMTAGRYIAEFFLAYRVRAVFFVPTILSRPLAEMDEMPIKRALAPVAWTG